LDDSAAVRELSGPAVRGHGQLWAAQPALATVRW
jgi:hypothetical protein